MGSGPFDFGWNAWVNLCGPRFRAHRRRHRRGRMFRRGDLKYIVLALLDEEPMHGYEVMQRLEEESGGYYSASPGAVYPVLQMLEDQGYVRAEELEAKRVYHITEEGRAFLREHRGRVEDVTDRVEDFASAFGGRGMGDVTRAFVRLAQVSFEAAVDAGGEPEAVSALREALERASGEIEALSRGPGEARRGGSDA